MTTLHRLISLFIAGAVPVATYLENGEIGFEFIVPGAIMGIAYRDWGPTGTPL